MLTRSTHAWSTLGVVLPLLGCGLMNSGPKKLCKRLSELNPATFPASRQSDCAEEFAKTKKTNPAQYSCIETCASTSTDKNVMMCVGDCMLPTKSKPSGPAVAKAAAVDGVTPALVKSRLGHKYRYRGFDVMKESNNAAGWSATLMFGKKSGAYEVYRVMLLNVQSKDDGYKTIGKLTQQGDTKTTRVGSKKALLVICSLKRPANGGEPKKCHADSQLETVASEIVSG